VLGRFSYAERHPKTFTKLRRWVNFRLTQKPNIPRRRDDV